MPAAIKTLYVLVGLPYSGKTTIATRLMHEHGALLIERDRFLEGMRAEPETRVRLAAMAGTITNPVSKLGVSRAENAYNDALTLEYVRRVQGLIRSTAKDVVIVDGTHLHALSRSFVRGVDGWRRVAVVLRTDAEECIRRLASNPPAGIRSSITPELIRRMAGAYEPPRPEEGFDEIRMG